MIQKQIIQSIQDLLLEHSYVTIPQLGGFVSQYQSAQLIPDKSIISPPNKKISFNANLKEDDGLLVNHLAKQHNLTVEKALGLIQAFVKDTFIKLDEGKKVVLEKVGTLSFNQQLNIEFESFTRENYNPYSYGMVDVVCNILTENEIVEKKNKQLFTRKNLMRAAVILPFLIVGTVLSVYLNQIGFFSFNTQEASIIEIPITQKSDKQVKQDTETDNNPIAKEIDFKTNKKNALAYTEPIKEIKETISEEHIVEAAKLEETQVSETVVVEQKEELPKVDLKVEMLLKYQLVAGSFKSESNAKRLSKKIQKLDYQATVVKKGNRYRVIAAAFAKKRDAVKAKKSLKKLKVSTWVNTLK